MFKLINRNKYLVTLHENHVQGCYISQIVNINIKIASENKMCYVVYDSVMRNIVIWR